MLLVALLLLSSKGSFASTSQCPKNTFSVSELGLQGSESDQIAQLEKLAKKNKLFIYLNQELSYDNSDGFEMGVVYKTNLNWCFYNDCEHISVADARVFRSEHGAAVIFSVSAKTKDAFKEKNVLSFKFKSGSRIGISDFRVEETPYELISKRIVMTSPEHQVLKSVNFAFDRRLKVIEFLSGNTSSTRLQVADRVELCSTAKAPSPKSVEF